MTKIGNLFHTIFVKGVWQTFCVAWIYEAFWKKFIVGKLRFDRWKGWVYLLPVVVLIAVFTVWPIFNTVRIAFLKDYSALSNKGGETFEFGIANFTNVVADSQFTTAMKNTILLCVLTVPLSTIIALLIAVCLNAIKPLQKLLQTIFFLPYVTNSLAIGMVFAAMFDIVGAGFDTYRPKIESLGLINAVLSWFNIAPVNWITQGSTYGAKLTVMVIYIVWNALPFKILVLLGGLQGINKQYYDAAKIDGASRTRIFFRVTVPLLSPMLAYVIITGFIGGFKEYTSVVGIFGDQMGPAGARYSMQTMVGLIYRAIEDDNSGRASAAALILFVLIFIVTMINLRVSKKKTYSSSASQNSGTTFKDVMKAIGEKIKAVPWKKSVKPIVAWSILGYLLLIVVALMIIFWVI